MEQIRQSNIWKRIIPFCVAMLLLLALRPWGSANSMPSADSEDSGETLQTEADEEQEEYDDWETRLLLMLQEKNANPETIGAGYYNLVTGEEHYYNADQYRISGSMYKVPLNMLFLNWISEGRIDMDESIGGYRYSQLLEGTIIDSNNDYARMLWDYAGATIETNPSSTYYHRYRILIAPLMGEDPDNVDAKYYENNFFTPRQMISCLRNLYEGGEKYEKLISTMQRAEPEKYFKLRERRFNIAHKYGWYAEDPILYLNDCAICFTDDPIAIVLFTSGTENAYGVLTDFCTLMCDYAQEKHAERLERERLEEEQAAAAALLEEQEKEKAEAEAQAERPSPQFPAAETSETPSPSETVKPAGKSTEQIRERLLAYDMDMAPMIALVVITVGVLSSLIWFSIRNRGSRFNLRYGLAAVMLTAAALLLCFPGVYGWSYISAPDENPQSTVVRFFQALESGNYTAADDCLAGGKGLGLSGTAENGISEAALRSLKESWAHRLLGECSVEKASAWQELQLQVLDFSRMEQNLQQEIRSQLLGLAREKSRDQIYDESGNCRPEAAAEAYDRAMLKLMDQARSYYSSVGLRVELTLTRDGWKIVPTKSLLSALCGNPE